jgi:hypothetical protein
MIFSGEVRLVVSLTLFALPEPYSGGSDITLQRTSG